MNTRLIRVGAVFAFAGALILVAMVVVGGPIGEQMAAFGQPGTPEAYAAMLQPVASTLITVMALDNVFLIAYTGTFIAAAALVWPRARLLAAAGLGFAGLLAVLDVIENALTVNMARAALAGVAIQPWEVSALAAVEQVKYASAALALVFFAAGILIALPGRRFPAIVAGMFVLFPVVNGLTVIDRAATPLLLLWMLVLLLAGGVLLWREGR